MNEYDVIAQALMYENWAELEQSDLSIELILAVNWICSLHDLKPLLTYDTEIKDKLRGAC
jgi:hypothetical protein